ncbi:Lon protease family protein [Candidatus Regiella endosymbiont of Tuberolachnus salignus]|uniref:Lon protease family protein n=1 Tax=Candidatus Regiella endosymbiont of Tuberolachnus salignus TaxID=3077956 RepID=UPI0030CAE7CD
MTNKRLKWQSLLPDTTPYQALFARATQLAPVICSEVQLRLTSSIKLFCHPQSKSRFMLIKAQESSDYLTLIAQIIKNSQSKPPVLYGGDYQIQNDQITWLAAQKGYELFATKTTCLYQEWVEPEQLFGCVRRHKDQISLQPGLIHQVNGGVLILAIHTLLSQPLMWLRLKKMIIQQRFEWLSPDEKCALPMVIPPIPLNLRLVIVGDRHGLGDFHDIEPELSKIASYGEFETQLPLNNIDDMSLWCSYINGLQEQNQLPPLANDAWPVLFQQAVRYSGDQHCLPLCPQWLSHQLTEAALHQETETITANTLNIALNNRHWRQSYLAEQLQNEIELGQILIQTEGSVIGQINGLSVLEYPGHPSTMGEPTRISCVVHLGDGEFVDVERKAELGGNLHAKGMMIMQAFLISELALEQPQPFSASIVFEQSYGDIDGDSASLAELCALISALSQQPIQQQLAVTGSVDQFGNVLSIGGINEKIEGFFEVCQRRGLTGAQGVILPTSNIRHLCLHQAVVEAVKNEQFHLWAVDTVAEALPLLTGLPYSHENQTNLLGIIQERIAQVHMHDRRRPWPLRWLSWLH